METILSYRTARKTSTIFIGCLTVIASAVSGCNTWNELRAGARVSPVIGRDSTKLGVGGYPVTAEIGVKDLRLVEPRPVNLDELKLPGETEVAYVSAQKTRESRNRLQDYLLRVSDEVCLEHKSSILAVSSTFNGVFSGATSVLGGLGAIFTAESTTRALSGAAGITNAFRDNFNQNVYYNNFAGAIVRQIDLQRAKQLQDMEPKRPRSPAEYSVDEAIRDVNSYHGQCSFSEAVAALASETKRPSTADELRGRLASLRSEFQANRVLIGQLEASMTPSDVASRTQLQNTNTTISRLIQGVTLQLALVEGVSDSSAPPTDTSKANESDPPPP